MVIASGVPASISNFLGEATSPAWLDKAASCLPELLIDHANCELKAASSALAIIYRYPERDRLVWRMSRLAREELRHFEQVRKLMRERDIPFSKVTASRYASTLRTAVRGHEPARLLDTLIVGALIEARSCERFAALVPCLPDDIATFYSGLLASEARHFEQYLAFARQECGIGQKELMDRVAELRVIENQLISAPDTEFRFHSGLPTAA